MTNEIQIISAIKEMGVFRTNFPNKEVEKVVSKAIKALEQEPFINKPCVSNEVCEHDKQKVLDKIRAEIKEVQTYKMFEGEDTVYVERKDVLAIIDKYKAESEE